MKWSHIWNVQKCNRYYLIFLYWRNLFKSIMIMFNSLKMCQIVQTNHQNLIETMSLLGRNLPNFAYLKMILYNCNHVNNSTRLKAWHVGKIYCFKIVCNGWYFWNSNMCFCSQLRYLLCVYYRTKKFCRDWRLAHYFVVAFEFMFGFNVLFFLSYLSYRQRRAQTKKM